MYLFKPKGVGTFLQTHVFIVFIFKKRKKEKKRKTFRLNYVLLLKISKSTEWMDPLKGENSIQSKKGGRTQ